MRIECPKCLATYDVPDSALPKERKSDRPQKMRCFKCKSVFSVMLSRDGGQAEPPKLESAAAAAKADVVNGASQWTGGNTLDLGAFEAKSHMPIRKFVLLNAIAALALIVLFFLFVAGRNDWVLSFPNLSDQITMAFWGKSAKPPPEEARELVVEVTKGSKIVAHDNNPLLVVTGQVQNPSEETRANVVLNGRLIGPDGQLRAETSAPCGRVFANAKLKKVKPGEFQKLYSTKGANYNCRVKGNSKRKYMLIFDNLPRDYSEKFKVEVRVAAADKKPPSRLD